MTDTKQQELRQQFEDIRDTATKLYSEHSTLNANSGPSASKAAPKKKKESFFSELKSSFFGSDEQASSSSPAAAPSAPAPTVNKPFSEQYANYIKRFEKLYLAILLAQGNT
ncbi:MAG: hypothetical protein WAW86_05915 [Gammaproteobacteria bacterium]